MCYCSKSREKEGRGRAEGLNQGPGYREEAGARGQDEGPTERRKSSERGQQSLILDLTTEKTGVSGSHLPEPQLLGGEVDSGLVLWAISHTSVPGKPQVCGGPVGPG